MGTFISYQKKKKRFSGSSLAIIEGANQIIEDYEAQGLDLTLRQIYYQFVSRDWIANKQTEYKRLGSILNDARMAGLVSWEAIEDRTRNLRQNPHWGEPSEIIESAANSYREDIWVDQNFYVEVWIEKDALVGVLEAVCPKNDVPYFSCRGYTSQSEMWRAAMRLNRAARVNDRQPIIIHLGDHDPSGVDMSRDISDRLNQFSCVEFKNGAKFDDEWRPQEIEVRRIALNMDQIKKYAPPPNPAKLTDARAKGYVREFGLESWELDALEPRTLIKLIQDEIDRFIEPTTWNLAVERQEANRKKIREMASKLSD